MRRFHPFVKRPVSERYEAAPNRQPYDIDIPRSEPKPGTCGTCKYWSGPTPLNYIGQCNNLVVGIGAPHTRERDSAICKGFEMAFVPAATPLSPDALSVLVRAEKNGPVICRGNVNPGIVRKLTEEGWASLVDVPNPYPASRKREPRIAALAITEKGKARIAFDEP